MVNSIMLGKEKLNLQPLKKKTQQHLQFPFKDESGPPSKTLSRREIYLNEPSTCFIPNFSVFI